MQSRRTPKLLGRTPALGSLWIKFRPMDQAQRTPRTVHSLEAMVGLVEEVREATTPLVIKTGVTEALVATVEKGELEVPEQMVVQAGLFAFMS